MLRKMAIYFFEKKDLNSATDTLEESLKHTSSAKNGLVRIRNLFRLVLAFQKINGSRVSEMTEITAKAIDTTPTPNPEDKPDSENYQKYVTSIMAVNWNLLPVISELLKNNRNEAISFASRLNR